MIRQTAKGLCRSRRDRSERESILPRRSANGSSGPAELSRRWVVLGPPCGGGCVTGGFLLLFVWAPIRTVGWKKPLMAGSTLVQLRWPNDRPLDEGRRSHDSLIATSCAHSS